MWSSLKLLPMISILFQRPVPVRISMKTCFTGVRSSAHMKKAALKLVWFFDPGPGLKGKLIKTVFPPLEKYFQNEKVPIIGCFDKVVLAYIN